MILERAKRNMNKQKSVILSIALLSALSAGITADAREGLRLSTDPKLTEKAIEAQMKQSVSAKEVKIEYRNPEEALYAMGKRTAILPDDCNLENKRGSISGLYPAFDITPYELCAGIITDKGFFQPGG